MEEYDPDLEPLAEFYNIIANAGPKDFLHHISLRCRKNYVEKLPPQTFHHLERKFQGRRFWQQWRNVTQHRRAMREQASSRDMSAQQTQQGVWLIKFALATHFTT